jgi:hypothetical protein
MESEQGVENLMKAYRKYITIQDPKHVVLADVPFRSGQHIEVVLVPTDDDLSTHIQALQTLFKTTQGLPQAQAISENEIAMEVEAYRERQ